MAKEKEKSCFIIMPITVPQPWLEKYRDEEDHFGHVLKSLFIPAVEKAGYQAIPPKAKGSDVIQANIIKNLETAELVLCDMSALNANVFFEFGIRTALNKPVCVVKDEAIKPPFDVGILNYHEYQSSLNGWELDTERQKLTDHILSTVGSEDTKNSLWKHFALKSQAQPAEVGTGENAKHEQVLFEIQSLSRRLDKLPQQQTKVEKRTLDGKTQSKISHLISVACPPGVRLISIEKSGDVVVIVYDGAWESESRMALGKCITDYYGWGTIFNQLPLSP